VTDALRVSIRQFDGPLDLLLHLITNAELRIEEIALCEITGQYLDLMRQTEELDMEQASAFLSVAAQLLLIKSRALLPRPPALAAEEENPADALLRQLREYQVIKEAASALQTAWQEAGMSYTRLPEDVPLPPQKIELEDSTLHALFTAYAELLARQRTQEETVESISRRVRPDAFTIRDRAAHIVRCLTDKKSVRCADLFAANAEKMEIVVTFLAVLELLGRGELRLTQAAPFAPIFLRLTANAPQDADYSYMDETDDSYA
jgi:segregation and condensation protein A